MSYMYGYGPPFPLPPRSEKPAGSSGGRGPIWVKALITIGGAAASVVAPRVADWWMERRQTWQRFKDVGLEFYGACRDRTDPLCMQREGVWGKHAEFRRAADKLPRMSDGDPQKALVQLIEDADRLAEAADSVERADPASIDTVRRLAIDFREKLEHLCQLPDPPK